jgi:hypothetical protein
MSGHYESNIPCFKRAEPFELAAFKAHLSSHAKPFEFYMAWPGFNVPAWVVAKLRAGALGSVTR